MGLRSPTVIYRLKMGWPVERAFSTPGRLVVPANVGDTV
jgi:hypothetical protein